VHEISQEKRVTDVLPREKAILEFPMFLLTAKFTLQELNTRIRKNSTAIYFHDRLSILQRYTPREMAAFSFFFSYKDAITREVRADSRHEDQRDCAHGFHGSFERSARTSTSVAARSRPTRAHAVSHRRRRRHLAPYPLEITLNLSTTLRALQGTGWRRWFSFAALRSR